MEPLELLRSLAIAATALTTLAAVRVVLALNWLAAEPDPVEAYPARR